MHYVVSGMLAIVGLIHLLPLTGALSSERIALLYGVSCDERNLSILLRHRAVLFGIVAGVLLFAAFHPPSQPLALVVGFVSVVSFLALAWSAGGYNGQIARVVSADIVALVCLIIAAVGYGWLTLQR